MVGARDGPGHADVGVAVERFGEGCLPRRLQAVVQFLDDACLQLGDQRFDVQPGGQRTEQPGRACELGEVCEQRRPRSGILDLDGDVASIRPHRPVNLADARRGRRRVVEVAKPRPPVRTEIVRQHAVDRRRR